MNREEILNLANKLVQIPSITGTREENEAAKYIRDWFLELPYFKENPTHLSYIKTQPEGQEDHDLHAVVAWVHAAKPTKRTLIFISHFDVVDVQNYGSLASHAFSPDDLLGHFSKEDMPPDVRKDLESGNFLFGRGSMDMKFGAALEMSLLASLARDRNLYDVNIMVAFVGDEENCSTGMRGAITHIVDTAKSEGLEFLACINTEPGDAGHPDGGTNPFIFLGSMGKILPVFYVLGKPAHVGNYYNGLSAALIASHLVVAAEGSPELADVCGESTPPSWICLETKLLKEGYNVTVPHRALVYFNCYTAKKTPTQIMDEMQTMARRALDRASDQIAISSKSMINMGYSGLPFVGSGSDVITYHDLYRAAEAHFSGDFEAYMKRFLDDIPPGDPRERGKALIEETLRISGKTGPLIVTAFLSPYMPPRSDRAGCPTDERLVAAAKRVADYAAKEFSIEMRFAQYYMGLCDLSYISLESDRSEFDIYEKNLPGWGDLYSLPFDAMSTLDMPVINLGPLGREAHRKYERVELSYSLDTLPKLMDRLIRELSAEK